ncbi:MAG: DUF1415 domain-containing protein [Burkholderiales bacterium]
MHATPDEVIAATRLWIERAVIGLNLCPFAKAVYVKEQIRYVVSEATTTEMLLQELERELEKLDRGSADAIDTTLIMHPRMLNDFLDYNDFLELADALVEGMDLEGALQVASFHPQYQFADTQANDMGNYSNRSPYPTLHLLREASVDAAVAAFPEANVIYERNIETLRNLGIDAWLALGLGAPMRSKH